MAKRRRLAARCSDRRGATAVEMALILPILLLIVVGLCVAQLGVFRYHQIAALAHESARWASVHGQVYSEQTDRPIANRDSILESVVRPNAAGLDLARLNLDVQWDSEYSLVTVTVSYRWIPEAFFAPQDLSCTAIALATY